MSNYRDDSISTAIVSDSTWTNTKALVTEVATLTASTMFGLMVMTTDTAIASDTTELSGRGLMAISTAHVTDNVTSIRNSSVSTSDQIQVTERFFFNYKYMVEDNAHFNISTFGLMRINHLDVVNVHGFDLSQRIFKILVNDSAKASSDAFANISEYSISDISATTASPTKLHSQVLTTANAEVIDSDISSIATLLMLTDSAHAESSSFGQLNATNFVVDYVVAEDRVLGELFTGQTWTAHADTMAMSRYDPFNFEGISILNGQLYAWNDQGVYRLGVDGEIIEGEMRTGKLDFGERLTHPTAAYLEYELSGVDKQIDIKVTTTQSGSPATYRYLMPTEQADYLTNGRIIFGRGLRGRHFAFNLNIKGTSSYIHSLSFEHTPTARRT